MSTTPYPPTDYSAVLSAKAGLTTEFGMGSGDPRLYGRAHGGRSHPHISFWLIGATGTLRAA